MQTGGYPDAAPSNVNVFPPQLFTNTTAVRKFVPVGLGTDSQGGQGSSAAEFMGSTNDDNWEGLLDLLLSTPKRNTKRYTNTGTGNFSTIDFGDASIDADIIKTADIDNDGDVDLYLGRGNFALIPGQSNALLRNDDGNFTLLPLPGIASCNGSASGLTAEFLDFDLDGLQDLFVVNEMWDCELWHNQGNGSFVDVARTLNVTECGFGKGVAVGDPNNDGYPDVFIATFGGANFLYMNQGGRGFQNVAEQAGVSEHPIIAFPTVFMDVNNDGFEDLFVGSNRVPDAGELFAYYTGQVWEEQSLADDRYGVNSQISRVYLNQGDGTFRDVSLEYGMEAAMGAMAMNVGDIDNDGWYDVYLGTGSPEFDRFMPNVMLNSVDGTGFRDVSFERGLAHVANAHGITFVDVNNDGFQDILESFGGPATPQATDVLFLNPGDDNGYNWIKVSLSGVNANRLGQGAKLRIDCDNGRTIFTRQGLGASFGSNPVTIQHVGLGNATAVSITVSWPHVSMPVDTYADLPVNSWVRLEEGNPAGATIKSLAVFDADDVSVLPLMGSG